MRAHCCVLHGERTAPGPRRAKLTFVSAAGARFFCHTCQSEWTAGRFSWPCDECGGGAMTKPCELCLGHCGTLFQRKTMRSNDSGMAEWLGRCAQQSRAEHFNSQWIQIRAVLRTLDVTGIQRELLAWSDDARWAETPAGPGSLRVLQDALNDHGLDVAPRVLAFALCE